MEEPRPWSLQARLAWRLAAVMAIAVVLAGAAVGWRAIATVNALEDEALQAQTRDIRRHLVIAADGTARLTLPPELDAAYRYSRDGDLYVVIDPAGHIAAASSADAPALIEPLLSGDQPLGFFRSAPGRGFSGLVSEVGPFRIVVAQGGHHRDVLVDSLLQEFLVAGLWLIAPIGVAAVFVGVMTIRRGLHPLRSASVAAGEIGPDRPNRRLPSNGLPREVRPLVMAVNSALDRLAKGLEVQRCFAADAAHELRTPLAVLTARLDTLTGDEALALRRDVDRMNRLVDQLLKMARLDGLPLDVTQPVDLHDVAVEAISLLAPLAIRRGRELVLVRRQERSLVQGNRQALVVALVNLVENALAHAPSGTAVEVEISTGATIKVLDRGPGVPESEREAIFQRFHRGRGESSPGAGLGLAIVAEIAAAHRGSVTAAGRPDGGAMFCLRLGT
jgi:signal transduction histidine kinase